MTYATSRLADALGVRAREREDDVAFRSRHRKTERGELELLRGIIRLANQLQSNLELEAIAQVIATALNEIFGFRESTVYLAEPGGETFRACATMGEHPEYDEMVRERPIPSHIWRELFLERYQIGSSYFIDHHQHMITEEQAYYLPPLELGPRDEDEWHADDDLFVPLFGKNHQLMGVLDLYDPVDRALPTLELVKSLEVFATLAAVAVENARQYEQLERATAALEEQLALRHGLNEISGAMLSTLDEHEVFTQIALRLKEIVDYDAMEVRLVDEEAGELYCGFADEEDVEEMQDWRAPLDEGVSGWVVRHNEPQLVNDMLTDPRGALVPGTERVPQASIFVPLTAGEKVIGVLSVDRMAGKTFAEHELEPVRSFANLAAIAIQNARSFEEMERQAICDGLTGIHNYRHFHDTLDTTVSRAGRYEESFCLLMMDLDHFKVVNDTVGHQAGDEVLRSVARVLSSCSRDSDYLARYGGEEFVMILPHTELAEARQTAERIRARVAECDTDGAPRVTISIGIASFPESATDSDGVLGAADAALLRAKSRGRDRVCLFTEGRTALAAGLDGDLVALGRRFASFIGMDEAEVAGLATALAVRESGGAVQDEVLAILGSDGDASAAQIREQAVSALVYANERWDGAGYPEGRRGSAIPRAARAFAVCCRYDVGGHSGDGLDELRGAAGRELDPRMVQRFTAMLRAEKAGFSQVATPARRNLSSEAAPA